MCIVNTFYKDIKLNIDRKDCDLWNDDILPRFICSIDFINNLGISNLVLNFSEYTAMNLLDFIACFVVESKEVASNVPLDCIGSIGFSYSLSIFRLDNNMYQITIFQHSIYNPSNPFPKVTIYFDKDGIQDLFYGMYFAWLIDLDVENGDISYMESIYSMITDQI